MRQYQEVKSQHEDAILFFRMGDFYEMFFNDAVVASRALELTLTSRDKKSQQPVPMCGVPHHAAHNYIRRLLELGHKIAICDQVEDPKLAKGLVRREVTQIITPGVVLDTDHLEAKTNNFLLALTADPQKSKRFGMAALDLSTFELRMTEVEELSGVGDELARLQPQEIIFPQRNTIENIIAPLKELRPSVWQAKPNELFGPPIDNEKLILEISAATSLTELELTGMPLAIEAGAAALRYAAATQPQSKLPVCRILRYRPQEYLQFDEATINNLELFESLMERRRRGSLLSILDETITAMGGRLLRRMLSMPLLQVEAIRRRLDAVEFLVEQTSVRQQLREALREIYDLERLTSRVVLGVATPRELGRLGQSLIKLPELAQILGRSVAQTLEQQIPKLLSCPADLLTDVATKINVALVEDPPVVTKDGGIIRAGYHADLDELIDLAEGGKSKILAIESRERERTGISSLKVRFNRVFGYYIEVTRANLRNVPDDYQRKQTLANAERFITPELAEYEAKVLGAEERRIEIEIQLFEELRRAVAAEAQRLTAVAHWVASLDALSGLAEVAQRYDYVRPEIDDNSLLDIKEGRHPVVERFLPVGQFVPNDVELNPDEGRMLILTGPNMAGKSTVMRQTALIALMGQMGSFVPAQSARLGIVDRIFTRVGASDNLARGESTFMVEMRETANILRHATSRSLVIIDEIGRGTATYDGISIAWAVAENLHDTVRAKCLFATHYHELCALAEVKAHARNWNIAVQEYGGKVIFLRKLVLGSTSRSYGIEVARLAGLDRSVIARARRVLSVLEGREELDELPLRRQTNANGENANQLPLFSTTSVDTSSTITSQASRLNQEIVEQICSLQTDQLTPLEALNAIAQWQARLAEKQPEKI